MTSQIKRFRIAVCTFLQRLMMRMQINYTKCNNHNNFIRYTYSLSSKKLKNKRIMMFSVMAPRCSQLLGVGHTTTRSFVTSRAFSVLTKFDHTNHNNNYTQQNTTAKPQQRCMSSTTTQSVSGAAKHIVSAVQSLNGVHFMSIDQLRYVIRHNSTRANGI